MLSCGVTVALCRYGKDVSVLEMDGQFDNLEELIYVESHLSNTSAKFYGEITQQMLSNSAFPGSQNGTGVMPSPVFSTSMSSPTVLLSAASRSHEPFCDP